MAPKNISIVWLTTLLAGQLIAAEPPWLTDLPQALTQARVENKIVLMDFTGSDWCPGCLRFHKQILDSSTFQNYAAKNIVVVEVDFPEKKAQSAELKKTNEALQNRFNVDGYPTLVVLDKDGKELARVEGFENDTPKAFISKLEKLKPGKS